MGTSVIKQAVLVCAQCFTDIHDPKALVQGSADPTDLRCPKCGSGALNCGWCQKPADRFAFDEDKKLTWNCYDGCNP